MIHAPRPRNDERHTYRRKESTVVLDYLIHL